MDYPFTKDGSSGGMTAAWQLLFRRVPPWNDLCIEHDYVYWRGGPAKLRRAADRKLRVDVAARGYPMIAWLMWAAVRIGGHPLLPLPWRWGYGWRWPKGYSD